MRAVGSRQVMVELVEIVVKVPHLGKTTSGRYDQEYRRIPPVMGCSGKEPHRVGP